MKRSLCFIVFLILSLSVTAQISVSKEILLKKIESAKEDSNKVELFYTLSNQYLDGDLKLAEKYCLLGGNLSKKLAYKKGVDNYFAFYTTILYRQGNFDTALTINNEAVTYAKKNLDSADIGRTLINLGLAYQQLADYENAVIYIEGGKDILNRKAIYKYDGQAFNMLQLLYYAMHQYSKGVHNGLQAVSLLEKSNDTNSLMYAYNNLALNYINLRQYNWAKYYLNKATTIANKDATIEITTNLNFALISLKLQQVDSIKTFAEKALQLSLKLKAHEFEALARYGLAYHYLLKKDYATSLIIADSALYLAKKYNLRGVKQQLYPILANLYYAKQNPAKGYYYFNQFELLNDSVLNESVTKNTIAIEKKYETQKKETQIKIQQEQIGQKSMLNYFFGVAAVALLVIVLLGYRNYSNRQKLQQLKIDELESEKKLTATEAILKGEAQERTRLAKDLHDGLGGMLSGIKYSLNTMKGNLVMTADNTQAFERSIDMLDSSIKEMRRVAHNMMPEILVRYGLDAALKELCTEIDHSGMLHVNYQSVGVHQADIPQTTSVTIYRIVQELLNNTIKHANAKNVLLQLHQSAQEKLLAVTVEDDGSGFDTNLLKESEGMGWQNIRNRIEFLKGRIDLQSGKDKGTSILIEINI